MKFTSRLRLIGAIALILTMVFALTPGIRGFAQDAASPVAATSVTDGPASPEQSTATETPALPVIPPETEQLDGNWPVPQGDLAASRNAVGSTIDSTTVADLQVAWTFDLTAAGFFGSITANPIVVGETVYIQDMQSNIFALDRATGALKWKAEFNVGSIGPNGVAVGYGMVYAGLSDTGEVVALNATDGSEVWRQKIGSPPGEGIDMAPIAYNGLVFVSTVPGTGLGSFYAEGDRGVLYAINASNGEVAWWFDTTDGGFDAPAVSGGGGLWYPPSFDAAGNIYFGVGNPAPWPLTPECPNGNCRPGDNAYTSSMVSLDGKTGAVRWYYQDRKHDLLDHDFQHTPILTTATVNGADVPVAIGAGKTGNVVAVNSDTGELLWKTPVGKHQNDDVTELPTDNYLEIYPGTYGGVESPIAYANGTVFVTYVDLPQYQGATGADPDNSANFADTVGGLVAINVADGSIKWEIKINSFVAGGATVANDVVFTNSLDGLIRGFNVETGEQVWSYEAESGFNAPPAIAGDMLFVGAGFVKLPPAGTAPAATPEGGTSAPAPVAKLIAFRVGGLDTTASPVAEVTTEATAAPATTPEPAATPEASAPAAGDFAITMVDIAYQPTSITIPANTDVVITLTNNGAAVHNFNVDELGVQSGDYQPAQTGTITINARPGTYQFYCSIPGHKEAGMVGTIIVQ